VFAVQCEIDLRFELHAPENSVTHAIFGDECTGPAFARWLDKGGHDVFSVYDDAPGIEDGEVLRRADEEERK
jgi:hypothetical protein